VVCRVGERHLAPVVHSPLAHPRQDKSNGTACSPSASLFNHQKDKALFAMLARGHCSGERSSRHRPYARCRRAWPEPNIQGRHATGGRTESGAERRRPERDEKMRAAPRQMSELARFLLPLPTFPEIRSDCLAPKVAQGRGGHAEGEGSGRRARRERYEKRG